MQARLAACFEAAPTPMALLDLDLVYVRVNAAYAAVVGEAPGRLSGCRYRAPSPHAEILEGFRHAIETGAPQSRIGQPLVYPDADDGESRYWDWQLTPLEDADGKITELLLTLAATEHRAWLRNAEITQAAVDKSKIAFYWIGPEGEVRYANDYACASLGYSREELLAGDIWLIDPDFPREAWPGFWEEFERRGVMQLETRHRRKDGTIFPVEVTCNHIVFDGEEQGGFNFVLDLSDRKRAERDLQLAHTAINKSSTCFYWLSPGGQVLYVNDASCAALGYRREELVGLYIWDFDPAYTPEQQPLAWAGIKEHGSFSMESYHRRKDGTTFPIEVNANHVAFGDEEYAFCFVQDISERRRAERELKLAHTAVNKSQTGFYWLSPGGQVIDVNDAAAKSLGFTRQELIGLYIWDFDPDFPPDAIEASWEAIRREGSTVIQSRHRRKDGTIFPIEATTNYVCMDGDEYTFTFVQDISERQEAEHQIRQLAFFDPLTQLPNRRLLMDRIEQALGASARSRSFGALMFIDLDNFKSLNDTQGHDVGDLLLLEVAERLRATVRQTDTVARLGGDEFVVMLPALGTDAASSEIMASTIADGALAALDRPFTLRGHEHNGSCSIGVCLFDGAQDQADELLSRADAAMYEAKRAGRGTVRFFDPTIQETLAARARLESRLRRALPEGQLELHYQLQVGASLQPIGAEALIRWRHPEEGMISPGAFIPVAEETGLILPIGRWVAETAADQLKLWEASSALGRLTVAINVSARQFRQPDFVQEVRRTLDRSGIDPARLKLELTESLVLHDVEDTIEKMRQIKALGVGFSLDDFGTGHSSLTYLKRLPLDQLKIDQSFVRDITTDPSDATLVQAIIGMGQNLGLEVIAEGVETVEQVSLLRRYGCESFQGYLFGRPSPASGLEEQLEDPKPASPAQRAAAPAQS